MFSPISRVSSLALRERRAAVSDSHAPWNAARAACRTKLAACAVAIDVKQDEARHANLVFFTR